MSRWMRRQDLFKLPGVAETLDWAQTLMMLNRQVLDEQTTKDTLGVLLKYQDDVEKIGRQSLPIVAAPAAVGHG